jgi:hypothetical protein
MQKDMFDMVNQYGQSAFDMAKQLNEINLRAVERLMEQQVAFTGSCVDMGARHVETLSKAKGLPEMVAGQAHFYQEASKSWLDGYKETTDILTEARQALAALMDEGVKTATTNLKQATAGKKAA